MTLTDGSVESLGDTPLSFSPDFILNNILTFTYRGMKASVQSQYVGDQYLTNTGIKSYQTLDDNGKPIDVSMMLDGHFFSAKYDNNGWAAPAFVKENGQVKATGWDTSDQYEAGFAPSAPFNAMAHLSVSF